MASTEDAGASSYKRPQVQLPHSCDPPGPNKPAKQKVWIVFGGTGHIGRSIVKAALQHGDLVTSVGRTQADNLATMRLAGSVAPPPRSPTSSSGTIINPGSPPSPSATTTTASSSSSERRRPHRNLLCLLCDVRVRSSVAAAIASHLEHWAGRLDVVANCSNFGVFAACEDQDDAEVRNQFETNFWGTLHILQLSLGHLRTHGGGRYLIFSSTSGALGVPGLGPYCATKYAVEGLVESMLYEVDAFDIKVTLVSPGHVRRDEPLDAEEEEGEEEEKKKRMKQKEEENGGVGTKEQAAAVSAGGPMAQARASATETAAAHLAWNHMPAYGSFVIKPASMPYSGSNPAGHAKRVVQWMADHQPTSVVKAAELVWQLAHCSYPPLRLLLGSFAVDSVRDRLRTILEEIEDWKFLSFGEEIDAEKARERIAAREPKSREDSEDDEEGAMQHNVAQGQRDRSGSLIISYDGTHGDDEDEEQGEQDDGEQYEEEVSHDEAMEDG